MGAGDDRQAVTRRQALKRGAVVGGALVWTVPAIQAVSLTAAHADSPSAPPTHRSRPPAASAGGTGSPVVGSLPNTGTSLPVGPAVAIAAGMIATGAVAGVAARRAVTAPAGTAPAGAEPAG